MVVKYKLSLSLRLDTWRVNCIFMKKSLREKSKRWFLLFIGRLALVFDNNVTIMQLIISWWKSINWKDMVKVMNNCYLPYTEKTFSCSSSVEKLSSGSWTG